MFVMVLDNVRNVGINMQNIIRMWRNYLLCPQKGFYLQSSSMFNIHLPPLVFNQFVFLIPES